MKKTKRIIIKSVQIKNFRSIKNSRIDAKDLNVLVGLNDVGKSNVLKALNLFFNGQTEYGVDFDFKRDFSYLFPKKSHMTKEIVVELKIYIPETYKEPGIYTWKKVWRTGDYMSERILNENGDEPSSRSRVPGTLKRIKFRYVPAVKSREYYKSLLAELYLTTASALGNPLTKSVEQFSTVIQEYTEQIHSEVYNRVGIDSRLSIPENLSETFKTLIFKTSLNDSDISVPLDMRGDGIQARHIPIVLKYVANQEQNTRSSGSMKITTIWGFEEPENGIELSKCFDMADEFVEYSDEIQIFLTTHSPAFYMKKVNENCQILYVTQRNEGTDVSISTNTNDIGKVMGLMPIVAPYIAEQERIIQEAKQLLENEFMCDVPTILVEGKTDKEYLELAINLYSEKLSELYKEKKIRIYVKKDEGGCINLCNLVYAWIYSGNKSKAIALFDKDEAGRKTRKTLIESEIYKKKPASASIQVQFLDPSEEIISLRDIKLSVPYEIEHLLSINCWKELEKKNLTEKRSMSELVEIAGKLAKPDKSIEVSLDETIENKDLLKTIVMMNPHKNKKNRIVEYVKKSSKEQQVEFMKGFKRTVEKLEATFAR